jgi:hypothetical protein
LIRVNRKGRVKRKRVEGKCEKHSFAFNERMTTSVFVPRKEKEREEDMGREIYFFSCVCNTFPNNPLEILFFFIGKNEERI